MHRTPSSGTFDALAQAKTHALLLGSRPVFESPTGVVITTRQVMEQGWPILLVTHDADEPRGWEFVNGRGDTEDATSGITVHVEHVIERDPSVVELADLPEGWQARRSDESGEWVREPIPSDAS